MKFTSRRWAIAVAVGLPLVGAFPAHAVASTATFVFQDGFVDPQLFSTAVDGTTPLQLTFPGAGPALFASHPAVSGDRTRIAYTESDAGVGSGLDGLYVANADGSNAHRIPVLDQGFDIGGDPLGSEVPAWSPDGTMIAISRSAGAATEQLFVVSASGGNAQLIGADPTGSDEHPRWSSAGLAFDRVVPGQPTEIWLARVNGTTPGNLTLGTPVQVTNDATGADVEPTWAPNGAAIAFARTNGTGVPQSGSSSRIAEVTLDASGSGGSTRLLSPAGGYDEYPAWSPDGTLIAFDRLGLDSAGAPDPSNTGQLELVSPAGGAVLAVPSPPRTLPQAPDWLRAATPPPPVLGKAVNAMPVSGQVFVRLPGGAVSAAIDLQTALTKGNGFVPLIAARQLPSGSEIDARRGSLQLVTAASAHLGKLQTGVFAGAVFKVTQIRVGVNKGLATLQLLEGAFPGAPSYRSCGARAAADGSGPRARVAASHRVLQTLRGRDRHGRFRTRGRYSAATVRGTEWDTVDRCDGTLTVVRRGTVDVFDFGLRRTITIHAGHRYLARSRRSS